MNTSRQCARPRTVSGAPHAWQARGVAMPQHCLHKASRVHVRVEARVFRVGDNWVTAPQQRQKVKGVIHFLGGAFAGAAPQVTYSLLLDHLAAAGFTVVATPYAVTFKHLDCAETVRTQFLRTLRELRKNSSTASLAPEDKPVFGVGHSNGSLLHLLIGSQHPGTTQGNVVISYNNKEVADAIPIPGFLDAVVPAITSISQSAPMLSLPQPDPAAVVRTFTNLLPKELQRNEAGQLSNATLAVEQLGMVFGEMNAGVTDFYPSPSASRGIIAERYDPLLSPVLFLRFSDDTIDQSTEMAQLLQATNPIGVSSLVLPGTHITPVAGDMRWDVGRIFTPLDALVQVAKWQSQQDVRRLVTAVSGALNAWHDTHQELGMLMDLQQSEKAQQQEMPYVPVNATPREVTYARR